MLASLDRSGPLQVQMAATVPSARLHAEDNPSQEMAWHEGRTLEGTKTPMGERLVSFGPGSLPFGCGSQSIHPQVASQGSQEIPHLACARSRDIAFPREVHQMTEYLQARHSEPCCRGALKNMHNTFTFLEEAAAVEDRLTRRALYGTVYKELLATARRGREPRQAPRIPAAILEGLEATVLDESCVFLLRIIRVVGLAAMLGDIAVLRPKSPEPRPIFCSCGKHPLGQTHAFEDQSEGDKKLRHRTVDSHRVLFCLAAELGSQPAQERRQTFAGTTCCPAPRRTTEAVSRRNYNTRPPPRHRQSSSLACKSQEKDFSSTEWPPTGRLTRRGIFSRARRLL